MPIKYGYNEPLTLYIKGDFDKGIPGLPGREWDRSNKQWWIPEDALETIQKKGREFGVSVSRGIRILGNEPFHVLHPSFFGPLGLYPFQEEAAKLAFERDRHILSFEMGLGKTPTAITTLKAWNVKTALIVTPAIVRLHWLAELNKWWSEHPPVGVINVGKARKGLSKKKTQQRDEAYAAPIQIVSYALLDEIALDGWEVVVFDEVHRLKTPGAKQSLQAKQIVGSSAQKHLLALTGTLVPNDAKDVWNVVDTLWPGRFGASKYPDQQAYSFLARYSCQRDNGYGTTWEGVNEEFAEELRSRLRYLSSRVTKAEVAHLLPPYTVSLLPVDTGATKAESYAAWKAAQMGESDPALADKMPHVKEWLEDASEVASHICLMTHLRQSASDLAAEFRIKGYKVFCIDGSLEPGKRNTMLAEAKAAKEALVIATMHSVGIGIDLTFCTQALFVELYYSPEKVVQAVGRFSRLSGTVSSNVQFLVRQNTMDEKVANILLDKIANANKIVKAGDGEEKVLAALGGSANEDELLASLVALGDVA